jgi:hypothetical protein
MPRKKQQSAFDARVAHAHRYNELRIWAATVEDLQFTRIKLENRDRAAADVFGYDSEDETPVAPYRQAIHDEERSAMAALVDIYRQIVPIRLYDWVEQTKGLGHPSMARLLGSTGDPCIAIPMISYYVKGKWAKPEANGDPYVRTVSALWAYCGHGESRPYRKGMTQEEGKACGNPTARRLTRVVAMTTVQARNPEYRAIYDRAKADGLAKGWTKNHAHMHGHRLIGKQILKELWIAAGGAELMQVPLRAAV